MKYYRASLRVIHGLIFGLILMRSYNFLSSEQIQHATTNSLLNCFLINCYALPIEKKYIAHIYDGQSVILKKNYEKYSFTDHL